MTMLNASRGHATTPTNTRRSLDILLARIGRLINDWIAAAIARHERQTDLSVLHQFSDRELSDIGLCRGDLGQAVAEAAKFRARKQQSGRD
jgi:uncharacterized protein YjiS (DUF1127 family)